MSAPRPLPYAARLRPVLAASMALLLATAGSAVVSGCGGDDSSTTTSAPPTLAAEAPQSSSVDMASLFASNVADPHEMTMTSAELDAAWSARPAYVSQGSPAVREAYAFALPQGSALTWMPCYCGCVGMGHGSNLDCFLNPRQKGQAVVFEEHASFCDVCIETALMTKRMLAAGSSLAEIRAAVDATFGAAGAPGTPTDMPQA
ncbi:MAG: PCYCGC motif-containing (lipo)protein [Chloroflexota bacterium]